MSQWASGYARRANEDYPTPHWVAAALARTWLREKAPSLVWEPAAGNGALADALVAEGFEVSATTEDFFSFADRLDDGIDAIITNPPYGGDRRGRSACDFIRHALSLEPRIVAMLLRIDFDSGKTRADLFRDHPAFAGKIVLLDRIKWFEGPSAPSDNHAWFVWDRDHRGKPWIAYCSKGCQ